MSCKDHFQDLEDFVDGLSLCNSSTDTFCLFRVLNCRPERPNLTAGKLSSPAYQVRIYSGEISGEDIFLGEKVVQVAACFSTALLTYLPRL